MWLEINLDEEKGILVGSYGTKCERKWKPQLTLFRYLGIGLETSP